MSANHTAAGMSTIVRTTGIVAAPSSSPSPLPIPVPYPQLVSASASGPAFVLVRRTGGKQGAHEPAEDAELAWTQKAGMDSDHTSSESEVLWWQCDQDHPIW
jgi:hypothetical protein